MPAIEEMDAIPLFPHKKPCLSAKHDFSSHMYAKPSAMPVGSCYLKFQSYSDHESVRSGTVSPDRGNQ